MNKKTMKSRSLWALTFALAFGATVIEMATAGDVRKSPRDSDKTRVVPRQANAVASEPEVAEPLRLTAALHKDGRWAIAGVVGLRKDVFGRTVIEVKKGGDFETDTVLSLFVPLVELDTGEVVPSGIVSVKNGEDTLTLTVRETPPSGWKTVAARGHTPSHISGCEGAIDENGNFFCVRTVTECYTGCGEEVIVGVTFCNCLEAE